MKKAIVKALKERGRSQLGREPSKRELRRAKKQFLAIRRGEYQPARAITT